MTKEELKKATGQELIEQRDYCGRDNYYYEYLENINAEMLKRFNRLAELEKENAKLKGIKDVATLIRANNDTVITLMQLNNMLVSKNQQLIKAKDHIKKLLDCLKQDTNDPHTNYYVCQYMDKAEQFLKDSEVEK